MAHPPAPTHTSAGVSDQELAVQAALGDRDAFTHIVLRLGPGMHRYALTMLEGDFHGAEDAVQEALTKAWQALPRFRGESSLRTWLFRITANEVLTARRRARPVSLDDGLLRSVAADRGDQPQARMAERELARALQDALAELPWRQRAAWILREVEQMPYAQIAAVLQTSETVVRGQLHRARRTLAVRMGQWR